MSSERWRRVRDLFDEAVELPPGDRAAFLEIPALSHVHESPFEEEPRSRIGP